jgi:hypothetical protein
VKIIDENLLRSFREKPRCEWCGKPNVGQLQPHHVRCRGMGGGGRLDVPVNLIALCAVPCHDDAHHGRITATDLLAVVAAREGVLQQDIIDEVNRLRRTPGSCRVDGPEKNHRRKLRPRSRPRREK